MRTWRERLVGAGFLAALTMLAVGLLKLLLSVPWALAIWLIASMAFALGWVCAVAIVRGKPNRTVEQWEAYADTLELEVAKADRTNVHLHETLDKLDAKIAKDALVMAELHASISKAYDAGVFAGQTIQRDREDNGLL